MFISRRLSAHRAPRRIAVLVLAAIWAPAVLGLGRAAAQEEKVGVVTMLRGQALVARPLTQQPLPLKFKDNVFVRDRVETQADSLVRVLLGGRALVTVRELSTFTATEGPNHVVIDLRTGNAAVGVAPSLLRPGETIEVRTPNAVAGIRGSLLVVSVVQVGDELRTTFEAPQASKAITISPLAMPGASIDLNANQSVNVTGMGAQTRVGPVTNMTATQAAAAARTAEAPRPREQEATSPMVPGIAAASIAQAIQLVVALQGPPTPDPLFQEATINAAQGGGATGNLASSISATSQLQVNAFLADQVPLNAIEENQPLPPSPPSPPPPPPPPSLCAGCVAIENQTLGLPPEQSIVTFTGTSTWPATIPVVRIDQSTVSGDASYVEAAPGSAATFAAPLLLVTNSTIETGGNVVHVGTASLDAAPTPALLSFDASIVNAGTGVIRLDGGSSLGVQGSLLTAQSTSFRSGDPTSNTSPFLGIFAGSSLEQTGASGAPLLVFDASPVHSAGALISVQGSSSTGSPSRLALDGPLLRAVNGTQLTMTGDTLGISNGGQFTGGSPSAALIELDNAQLTTGPSFGSVLQVGGFGATGATPATATLGGTLLNAASGSTLNLTGGFIQVSSGGQVTVDGPGATNSLIALHGGNHTLGGDAIGIFSGGQFTGGSPSAALIELDNSAELSAARSVLRADGVGGATGATPATATLGGTLLNAASGSTLSLTEGFIQAANGGQIIADPGATTSLITLHGGSHTLGASAIGVFSGGQFSGGSPSAALIDLDNAQLTTGPSFGSVLQVGGFGATGATPATATLGGTLLNAGPGSALDLTGGFIQVSSGGQVVVDPSVTTSLIALHGGNHTLGGDAIGIFSGGQFTGGSPSAALIELDNGAELSAARSVLRADGVGGATGATPATATLGGALLNAASGSTLSLTEGFIQAANGGQVIADPGATTSLITLHGGSHTLGASAIGVFSGGQFTGGSPSAALIDLDNAQLTGLNSVLQVGGFGADGVTPATATLGGTLLNAGTGSTLNLTGGVIQAANGGQVVVDPSVTNSLITLRGGSHTLGASAIGVLGGGQFTGGSPSAALIDLDNAQLTGARSVLEAEGVGGATGGTPATATLRGALLNAGTGSALNLTGGVIQAANGGQVVVDPSVTTSLITLRGGSHTLGASAIGVLGGGQFTGGSPSAALIDLDNAQLTGARSVLEAEGVGGATGGTPATATLRGALLNASTGSALNLTGGFIQAANSGQVTVDPGVTTSLITLHGGSHTLGASAIGVLGGGQFTGGSPSAALIDLDTSAELSAAGSVLRADGVGAATGATPATATLGGALLNAGTGSALNLTGGVIQAANGGQVVVDPSVTTSLITLHGGSHTLGASAIGVLGGGQFTGGSPSAALIDLDNAQLTGARSVLEAEGVGGATGGTPATATLRGALLNAGTGSALNLTGGFIQAANSGQVTVDPGVTNSLITLHGGSHTLGASAIQIANGGQFTGGSASAPLIDVDNAQLTGAGWVLEANRGGAGGTPGTATLRGALLNAANGSTLNLTGGFIEAASGGQVSVDPGVTNSLITLHGGSHTLGPSAISILDGGQFTAGSASAPLIDLDNAQLTGLDWMLRADGVGGTPATASLRGALLNAGTGSTLNLTGGFIQAANGGQVNVDPGVTNSLITLHGGTHTLGASGIGVFGGGQFTGGSASAPLIDLDNAQLTGPRSVLEADGFGGATGGTPARATLRGTLLNAGNGSTLSLTQGFIQASTGGQVVVDPGVTNSLITLRGGTHTLGSDAITVFNEGQFTAGGANAPVINLDNAQLRTRPLSPVSGDGRLLLVDGLFGGFGATRATLTGPLLNAANGSSLDLSKGFLEVSFDGEVTAHGSGLVTLHGGSHTLGADAILIRNGGQFTGGGPSAALIDLDSASLTTTSGGMLSALFSQTILATAHLEGALLNAGPGSALNLTGGFIQASTGGAVIVDPGVTNALVTLHGGTHTLGASAIGVFSGGLFGGGSASAALIDLDNAHLTGARSVLEVDGVGGSFRIDPATANLRGALLNAGNGSTLSLTGGFIQAANGGEVIVDQEVTNSLVTLQGGSHTIAAAVPTGSGLSMFDLSGRPANVTTDPDGFVVNADRPLRQDGGRGAHLLEMNGATIGEVSPSQQFLRLDSALLDASLPLLRATNNSLIRTATDAIDLSKARLTTIGDLIQLNASQFQVVSGALASVRNGSSLVVGGNLVTLMNGSSLMISNGPVLNVSGNSRVDITGALIGFSGTPSTVTITNNLCSLFVFCTTIGGLRVRLDRTPVANVIISNPVTGAGTVTLSPNAAHLVVSGGGSRVTIGPR